MLKTTNGGGDVRSRHETGCGASWKVRTGCIAEFVADKDFRVAPTGLIRRKLQKGVVDGRSSDTVIARLRFAVTSAGNWSALANNAATCHICVSFSESLKAGMPDRRIPFFTFQKDSPTGSSVTMSSFSRSCGALGNIPFRGVGFGLIGQAVAERAVLPIDLRAGREVRGCEGCEVPLGLLRFDA